MQPQSVDCAPGSGALRSTVRSCDTRERKNGAAPDKEPPFPTLVAIMEQGGQSAQALCGLLERTGHRAAVLTPLPHHDPTPRLAELARQGHRYVLLHYLPDAPLPPEEALPHVRAALLADTPRTGSALPLLRRADVAVLDGDDRASLPYRTQSPCPVFTYSERHPEADLTAENTRAEGALLRFEAVMRGQIRRVFLSQTGSLDLYHALAVLSTAVQLGLSLSESADALSLPLSPSQQRTGT